MKLYKITGLKGEAINGGNAFWPLPKNGKPGRWTPNRKPYLCVSGWHLLSASGVKGWLDYGEVLWEAEGRGRQSPSKRSFERKSSEAGNRTARAVSTKETKIAFSSARLLKRVGTLTRKKTNLLEKRLYAEANQYFDIYNRSSWSEYQRECEKIITETFR